MIEYFNFEAVKDKKNDIFFYKGEWLIDMSNNPLSQNEFAPAKDFYKIQKRFHENGMIKFRCHFLGNVPFGLREEFDEKGNIIQSIDEDAKFGKIKPKDLVEIIEKVGWIDREKGESILIPDLKATDGLFTNNLFSKLTIGFANAEYDEKGNQLYAPHWYFYHFPQPIMYQCIVNGDTGEYKIHEIEMFMEE